MIHPSDDGEPAVRLATVIGKGVRGDLGVQLAAPCDWIDSMQARTHRLYTLHEEIGEVRPAPKGTSA